jgi:hypothetical protein
MLLAGRIVSSQKTEEGALQQSWPAKPHQNRMAVMPIVTPLLQHSRIAHLRRPQPQQAADVLVARLTCPCFCKALLL